MEAIMSISVEGKVPLADVTHEERDVGEVQSVELAAVEEEASETFAQLDSSNANVDPHAMDVDEEEDGGVIRCICLCEDDDGFTIQCDQCLVWQHCACMGMTSEAMVPETYLCEQCDPDPHRKVDATYAQALQQRRRDDEQRRASLVEILQSQQRSGRQISEAEAQWLAQQQKQQKQKYPEDQPGAYCSVPAVSSPSTNGVPATSSSGSNRSRKQAVPSIDLGNAGFIMPTPAATANVAANTPGGQNAGSRGGHNKRRSNAGTPGIAAVSAGPKPRASGRNEEAGEVDEYGLGSANHRTEDLILQEAWRVEYTPLSRNLVTDRSVLTRLQNAMRPYQSSFESGAAAPLCATPIASGKWVVPVIRAKAQKLKPDHTKVESLGEIGLEDGRIAYDAVPTEGLTAIGNECRPVEISVPVESLHQIKLRTYVKQISEAASASIFSNVLQSVPPASEPQRACSASKTFSRPVMHGLFAEQFIPAGSFIMEFKGELSSADSYRRDPRNMYDLIGCTKPHVHILPPPLNIVIDARRFGNEVRFARYSCHPNAVIRPILFRKLPLDPSSGGAAGLQEADIEPELLFGLFAIGDISKMHEITVGWEWDDLHIVHLLPRLVENPLLEDFESQGHNKMLSSAARQAALLAFVERGEFPYASTLFSAKMNALTTTLLGSTLCACIGSASAPGGSIGASANNGKRQDCAIVQMLRVAQGMALLNVNMPGKSNRKSKLPDFKPLVGVRRWWRPTVMPPTPESSRSDPFEKRSRRNSAEDGDTPMDDADDVRSQASSLTEALSGLSESESESEADSDTWAAPAPKRDDETDWPKILPPKKRISGTRIKATYSDSESEGQHGTERQKYISAASAGASSTRGKRKAKRPDVADPLPEDAVEGMRKKKRTSSASGPRPKQARRMTNRSSPLSSITSQDDSEMGDSDEEEHDDVTSEADDAASRGVHERKRMDRAKVDRRASLSREQTHSKKKATTAEKTRKMLMKLARDESASSSSESESSDISSSASDTDDTVNAEDKVRAVDDEQHAKQQANKKKAEALAAKATVKKKARRVMESSGSDSEGEEPERSSVCRKADSAITSHTHVCTADISKGAAAQAEVKLEVSVAAVEPTPVKKEAAPEPLLEPEQPRAKMSLADYRKRLMEKRNTTVGEEESKSKPIATSTPLFGSRLGLSTLPGSAQSSELSVTPALSSAQPSGTSGQGSKMSTLLGSSFFADATAAVSPGASSAPPLPSQMLSAGVSSAPTISFVSRQSALSVAAPTASAKVSPSTGSTVGPTGVAAGLGLGKLPSFAKLPASHAPATGSSSAPPPAPPLAPKPFSPEQAHSTLTDGGPSPRPQPSPKMWPVAPMAPPPGISLQGGRHTNLPQTSPRGKRKSFDGDRPRHGGPGINPFVNARASDQGWASRASGSSLQGSPPSEIAVSPGLAGRFAFSGSPAVPAAATSAPFSLRDSHPSPIAGSMPLLAEELAKDQPSQSSSTGGSSFTSAFSPPPAPAKMLLGFGGPGATTGNPATGRPPISPAPGTGKPSGFAPVTSRGERGPSIANLPTFDPPKGPRALMAAGGPNSAGGGGPRGGLLSAPLSGSNAVFAGNNNSGLRPGPPGSSGSSGSGGIPHRRDFAGVPTGPRIRDEDVMMTGANSISVADRERERDAEVPGRERSGSQTGLSGSDLHALPGSGPALGLSGLGGGGGGNARDMRYSSSGGGGPMLQERGDFRAGGIGGGGSFHPPPRGNGWGGRARIRGGPRGGPRGGGPRVRGRGGWGGG